MNAQVWEGQMSKFTLYRGTDLVTILIQILIVQGGETIPTSLGMVKDNKGPGISK